jgi:hypothetical protein
VVSFMEDKNKPFNDAIDHFNQIEGNAGSPNNAKLSRLPKPLKFFGYFLIGFFSLSILLMIIFSLLN